MKKSKREQSPETADDPPATAAATLSTRRPVTQIPPRAQQVAMTRTGEIMQLIVCITRSRT